MLQELAANPFDLFIKYVNNKRNKMRRKDIKKKLISYSFKGKNGNYNNLRNDVDMIVLCGIM